MNTHNRRRYIIIACLVLLGTVSTVGCRRPPEPVQTTNAPTLSPASKLSKIVFVGKEHACECTRKSVDAGWAALQKVLGSPGKIPVERMHVDTESARVAPYREQKPIMALPAIYFVDGKGSVLDMLQGEVGEAQIQPILEKIR
jgi:hypothetical protein